MNWELLGTEHPNPFCAHMVGTVTPGLPATPTVGILKIESADGAIQIRSAVTVVQIEGGGQRNWLQGLAPAACVYVSGSDFILVRARSATGAEAAQALKKIVRRSVLLHNHYHVLDRVVW
jgi:hypothetical protein